MSEETAARVDVLEALERIEKLLERITVALDCDLYVENVGVPGVCRTCGRGPDSHRGMRAIHATERRDPR